MSKAVSTSDLVRKARRLQDAEAFFALFPSAWRSLRREVWKLETRQVYQEPGNPSWELLVEGDLAGALALIPSVRQVDVDLYNSLAERGVEFLRCRPVQLPLTSYLEWELGCYDFNAKHGEKIFFVDRNESSELFDSYALHDFLIFDDHLALVHDYDDKGLIRGGWEITAAEDIKRLRELYECVRQAAVPFLDFLGSHGLLGKLGA